MIREYDEYFSDLENLLVPLMASYDEQMFTKSFIDIDFSSVHEEVNIIIKKIAQIIDRG